MRNQNNIVRTGRHAILPSFLGFTWLILSVLLSATSAIASDLIIYCYAEHLGGTIATGTPFDVDIYTTSIALKGMGFAGSGKVAVPYPEFGKNREAVNLVEAKVDNPAIVEIIETRRGGWLLLRGKVPGETTLRVKTRNKLGITQTATATVKTAVPKEVRMNLTCGDGWSKTQTPVQVPVNLELDLTAELYSDKTPKTRITVKGFPEVDLGALIPVERKNGRKTTKDEFIATYYFSIKAPASATRTSVKVPAYGYELPIQVYEPSAISEIRISAPEKMCVNCGRHVKLDLLVGGEVPCLKAIVPVDVTIGPATVCSLKNDVHQRKTDSGNTVYEMAYAQNLTLVESGNGTCVVTVEAKSIGKSASRQFEIKN